MSEVVNRRSNKTGNAFVHWRALASCYAMLSTLVPFMFHFIQFITGVIVKKNVS